MLYNRQKKYKGDFFMKRKFYLQTWFISLLFFFSFLGIAVPPMFILLLVGIILIFLQHREDKKLFEAYGSYDQVVSSINNLNREYEEKSSSLAKEYSSRTEKLDAQYKSTEKEFGSKISSLKNEIVQLSSELLELSSDIVVAHYNFSDYEGLSSEECKNKLSLLKNKEQDLIKSNKALSVTSSGSKKEINDNMKQILRCFQAECNNSLVGLSHKNIDSIRGKITKSFETLNKIFAVDGVCMTEQLLELKLEELNLLYTFELKQEQEREQQKAIKEQMIEEEKVRREIERQKAKIEKDQTQCSNEVKKLMAYMQKSSNDVEKQLYVDKIKELEEKLRKLEADKETVLEREANARAGFVYVISNIGSFGENIYKIGMTRRLEPMDRIKELSSASVPFEFDVHAMIFSDNAPELENILHKHFEKQSVNRVNLRKEFFRVSLDEIEKVVKENFNNTVSFTRVPVAEEYRQTLNILSSES